MSGLFRLFILALLAWPGAGYSATVLVLADVQNFKVAELNGRPPYRLRVEGLAMHSALATGEVRLTGDGDVRAVVVPLRLAGAGHSGSFASEFTVPDSVQKITFGESGPVIWTRPREVAPQSPP